MSKQKKFSLKSISITLVFCLVFTCIPLVRIAKLFASAEETEEEPIIICEVEDRRDKYSKTYLKSDGSFVCINSGVALHTWDDSTEKWLEIDNSLVSKAGSVENGDSDISVKLPEYLSQANAVSVSDKDQHSRLTLKLRGITYSKAQKESKSKKRLTNNKISKMSVEEILNCATSTGSVTYSNALSNTDLKYDVIGDTIKESIIIKTKPKQSVSYTYDIGTDLIGVLNEDHSVLFFDKNTYETKSQPTAEFMIPSPFIEDSNGNYSNAVETTLTSNKTGYTLTYTPDWDWLNESQRAYPVTLDPTIQGDSENITSGYISCDSQSYTKNTTGTLLYVGAYGINHNTYIKQKVLPTLPSGAVITNARLYVCQESLSAAGSSKPVNFITSAYTVNEDWEALTEHRQPTLNTSSMLDWVEHTEDKTNTFVSYDITETAIHWFDKTISNYGICITYNNQVYDNQNYGVKLYSSNHSEPLVRPYFVFEYRDYSQMEGKSVRELDVGRAGTIVISDRTGNLKLERKDAGIDGNVAPVSISMLFNSRDVRKAVLEGGPTGNVYGAGFRTNYNQTLNHQYGSSVTQAKERYEYVLGDGSVIHFERQIEDKDVTHDTNPESIFVDTSGSGYKLHMIVYSNADGSAYYPTSITSGMYVIDKNKQRYYFDASGRLNKVVPYSPETAENVTAYSTPPDGKSFESGVIKITYENPNARTNLKIDKITDGAGRVYQFNYTTPSANNTQLSSISSIIDGTTKILVEYTYQPRSDSTSYNLLPTSVKYADGKTIYYTWDHNNMNIKSAKDTDGYSMEFSYITALNNHRKVSQITEYGTDGTQGQNAQITYGNSWTSYKNISSGEEEKIFFDYEGNIIMMQDGDGNAIYGKYDKKKDEDTGIERNRIVSMSAVERSVPSLLQRPISSAGSSRWALNNAQVTTENMYLNKYGFKLSGNAKIETPAQISLNASGYYTFSAYVKTENAINARLRLKTGTGSNDYAESKFLNGTNDYVRLYCVTVVDPYTGKMVLPQVISEGGTVWVDAIQLEPGDRAGETHEAYNLVNNSAFWQGMADWEKSSNAVSGTNEDSITSSPAVGVKTIENPNMVDAWNYLWIQGHANKEIKVIQTIPITNGKKGDQYTFGAWSKLFLSGNHTDSSYQVRVKVIRAEGVNTSDFPFDKEYTVTFNPAISEWQYALSDFTAEYDYTSLVISLVNKKQSCKAYFDGIQLYRTTFGQNLIYDAEGNLIGSQDILQYELHPEDIENPDLDDPSTSKEKTTKDKYGRITESVSAEGVGATTNYDKLNNPLISRVTNGRVNIEKRNEYTNDGNYQTASYDEFGNKKQYQYSRQTGNLDWATDGKGFKTYYTYNNSGLLSGISKDVQNLSSGNKISKTYTYDAGDRLKSITHNGFNYTMDYTPFGELSLVKVGNQTLAQYTYNNTTTDRILKNITFGNGQTMNYNYSAEDHGKRIQKVSDINSTYFFNYDSSGILKRVKDNENNLTTTYAVDSKGDTVATTIRQDGSQYYTYSLKTSDKDETILFDKVSLYGSDRNIHYVVDKDGRNNGVWWDNIRQNYRSAKEIYYDDLGRRTSEILYKGYLSGDELCDRNTTLLNVMYSYRDLPEYKTSNRITSMTIQGAGSYNKQFSYGYDGNGNITQAGDVTYSYDQANQLDRVNDPENGTKTYVYDAGGNIASVREYDYTTGSLQAKTPKTTITYGYDSVWKDKLISYNGNSISYDAIGNPLHYYNGMTFTWKNGQQLSSIHQSSKTTVYKYDQQGRRLSKKSSDSSTDVEYTYADHLLTTLKDNRSGKFYIFYYDSDGRAISCAEYAGGGTYNYYYYVHNLHGDVIAILDSDGKVKVEYQYDAWGKILNRSHDGSEAGYYLSVNNPFRFRGYQYDEDTGLYYLKSRYYDPTTGRFLNADSQFNNGLTKLNLFAYADNNPVNAIDSQGTDAIWLQDTDAVYGLGHSGALFQDSTGIWYHFYWGANGENSFLASGKKGEREIAVNLTARFFSNDTVESINHKLHFVDKVYCGSKYEGAIYFKGDYSESVKYILQLQEDVETKSKYFGPRYNFVGDNCVQETMKSLIHGEQGAIEEIGLSIIGPNPIPNVTYEILKRTYKNNVLEEIEPSMQLIYDLEAQGKSRTQMLYELSNGL